ncbi:right-handed parallel beta-helix repeat-containing protein [Micromonospora coxensis]|uniref:Right handed beta helix region n=1 Tax=Micromonospora coxensis TaxID=356852 RepID=A0A1C5IVE0_9ACTN|nr:right-handed parallel beta-helix repeat-containing protein [Micromonospora coxensis]SCG62318.1 Right handed beta helix region [Micromonospora coxensis]
MSPRTSPARRTLGVLSALVLAVAAVGLVEAPASANTRVCHAGDLGTYGQCVAGMNANAYDQIVITSMIQVPDGHTGGYAISGVSGKRISGAGDGVGFHYQGRQSTSIVSIHHSQHVVVENLRLSGSFDGSESFRCTDGCGAPVFVFGENGSTQHITFDRVHIRNVRADAAVVLGTWHLNWWGSTIENAGEMGLHLGYDEPVRHNRYVRVEWNTFRDIRVNALWLQVSGAGGHWDNGVANNYFERNHRAGIYSCGGRICDGGQIVIAPGASWLTLYKNVVTDSSCGVCVNGDAHGIEMNTLTGVKILDNRVSNHSGISIYANSNSVLNDLEISWNQLFGNDRNAPQLDRSGVQRNNVVVQGNSA